VAGGGKVSRQAETIGWPMLLRADSLDDDLLAETLDRCLAPAARELAASCAARAARGLDGVRERLLAALGS